MDLEFVKNNLVFNNRVCGTIIKDNKVLLVHYYDDDYWTFIGGRPLFGEIIDEAIVREFQEETGTPVTIIRLLAFLENFFVFENKMYHQHLFFYLLNDNNQFPIFDGEKEIIDEPGVTYRWFDIDKLNKIKIKPNKLGSLIYNIPKHPLFLQEREENFKID